MSSTFGMLESARSGLNAAQVGMSITSHNQSNADTDGYTRQALDTSALPPDTGAYRYASKNNVGQGVKINSVYQIRDTFLDVRYRYANSTYSMYDSMDSQMRSIEDQFNEIGNGTAKDNKLKGLTGSISDLIGAFGSLSTNPTNADLCSVVESNADYICKSIRGDASALSTALAAEQKELNVYVTGGAGDTSNGVNAGGINGIIENIQSLNEEIQSYELTGKSANDLRDQRNVALDKLSSFIDIDTTEQANGMVTVKLKNDDDGKSIIDASNNANEFQLATSTSKKYTVLAWGDSLSASGTRTTHSLGNPPTVSGAGDIANVQGGIVKAYLNVINGDGSGSADDPTTGQCGCVGIAYLQKKLNDFAISFMNVMNNANGVLGDSKVGNTQFITYLSGGSEVSVTPPAQLPMATNNVADTIQVTSAWAKTPSLLMQNYSGADADKGPYYGEYYKTLQDVTAVDTADGTTTKMSLLNYASSFSNEIATAVGKISDSADQNGTTRDNLGDQRDAISSVSSNDEAVNMIKYQQAFSASSRIITAIDQMLDKLINGTGIVGQA